MENKIKPGRYRTRAGAVAVVLGQAEIEGIMMWVGHLLPAKTREEWTMEGAIFAGAEPEEDDNDLVARMSDLRPSDEPVDDTPDD